MSKKTKIGSGSVLHTTKEREPVIETPPIIEDKPLTIDDKPSVSVSVASVPTEKQIVSSVVKLVRITPFESFILIQDHDICVKEGVCTCSLINGKRSPKTVHIVAGIPVVIPATMLDNKVLQDKRKRGKVILKRL
jgi:hypothetical protein